MDLVPTNTRNEQRVRVVACRGFTAAGAERTRSTDTYRCRPRPKCIKSIVVYLGEILT